MLTSEIQAADNFDFNPTIFPSPPQPKLSIGRQYIEDDKIAATTLMNLN